MMKTIKLTGNVYILTDFLRATVFDNVFYFVFLIYPKKYKRPHLEHDQALLALFELYTANCNINYVRIYIPLFLSMKCVLFRSKTTSTNFFVRRPTSQLARLTHCSTVKLTCIPVFYRKRLLCLSHFEQRSLMRNIRALIDAYRSNIHYCTIHV